MRDEYRHLVFSQTIELIEHVLLRNRIECRRRLIKYQHVRFSIKGTCYSKLLPLSARELYAVFLKYTHKRRIEAVGQLGNILDGIRFFSRAFYILVAILLMYISKRNIFADRHRIFAKVLKDYAEHTVKVLHVIIANIITIKIYTSLGRIVESCKKLDKCCFSCSVESDKNNRIICRKFEIHVFQHIALGTRIAEADIIKFYGMRRAMRYFARLGYTSNKRLLLLHKGNEIVYKQRSLIYRSRGIDKCSNTTRYTDDSRSVQGIITDKYVTAENILRYMQIKIQIRRNRQHTENYLKGAFLRNKLSYTSVVVRENSNKSVDKGVRKVKKPYLLNHILVDENIRIIVHLASFLRAVAHISEVLSSVYEVGDSARHGDCNYHKHRISKPRSIRKYHYIADKLDHGTYYCKRAGKYIQWAHTRLAVCVLQLLVKLRNIEGCEVYLASLFHYLKFDLTNKQLSRNSLHRARCSRFNTL